MEEMELKKPYFEPTINVYEIEPIRILGASPSEDETEPVGEEEYVWWINWKTFYARWESVYTHFLLL